VEVALYGPPAIDRDLLSHQRAQAIDHGALRLILGAAHVDDGAPDVAGNPDLVDTELVPRADGDLRDLGEEAAMAELEGDAAPRTFRQRLCAPGGLVSHELQDAAHPRGVEPVTAGAGGRRTGRGRHCAELPRNVQEIEPELQRVFSSCVRQFVEERLEDERERVAARRAQRARRHAERHQRRLEREVRDEACGGGVTARSAVE
jgi:hypothetical protein